VPVFELGKKKMFPYVRWTLVMNVIWILFGLCSW